MNVIFCRINYRLVTVLGLVILCSFRLQAQDPYPNFDLSEENFSNWKIYRGPQQGKGSGRTIQYIDISTDEKTVPGNAVQFVYPPTNPRAKLEDANTCYNILKIPEGKKYCMRVGPLSPGGYGDPHGYKAAYTLHVVPERATLVYRFAFVQQYDHGGAGSSDPLGFGGGASGAYNNAQFWVQLLDKNSTQIGGSCANYRLYPGAAEDVEWFTWNQCGEITNTPWMTDVVDLTPYIGQDVTIEFNTMDCYTGHHMAYAYVSPETFTSDTVSHYCPYNDTAFVEAPRGFKTYEWKELDGTFSVTKENSPQIGTDIASVHQLAVPNPVAGTKYECTFTSYSGCSGTVVYEMVPDSVHAQFTYDISTEKCRTILCFDSSNTDYDIPISDFAWTFIDESLGIQHTSTLPQPEYTFSTSGTHAIKLSVTSEAGCSDSIYAEVQIPDIKSDFQVEGSCVNDSLQFSSFITREASLLWEFDDGYSDTSKVIKYRYQKVGEYAVSLTVTTPENCTNTITKQIAVTPLPNAMFEVESVCVGEGITLIETSTIETGEITFWQWGFGDGSASKNNRNPVHAYTQVGQHTISLLVESEYGCVNTVEKTIEVLPLPSATFSIDQDQGCVPSCLEAFYTPSGNQSCQWRLGNDFLANGTEVSFCIDHSGIHELTLEVSSQTGCTANNTAEIDVHDNPKADFETNPTNATIRHLDINFINQSQGATTYNWSFGDGTPDEKAKDISHTYPHSGEYEVMLTASNHYGCKDSLSRIIVIDSVYTLKIPNAFSPNGDGIHDFFVIKNIEYFPKAILTIFNQWGELIYTSTSGYQEPWNGTQNGQPLPVSTYYYTLDLQDEENQTFCGYITLIR